MSFGSSRRGSRTRSTTSRPRVMWASPSRLATADRGPLEPTNEPYAIAKIAGLKMCQAYRRQHGFNAICIMPTNPYGPGDNFSLQNSHVLPAEIVPWPVRIRRHDTDRVE